MLAARETVTLCQSSPNPASSSIASSAAMPSTSAVRHTSPSDVAPKDDMSHSSHVAEGTAHGIRSVRRDEGVEAQHGSRFMLEEQAFTAQADEDARHADPQWEHQRDGTDLRDGEDECEGGGS